jgi:hyperosmotically inducible periplasmic protein
MFHLNKGKHCQGLVGTAVVLMGVLLSPASAFTQDQSTPTTAPDNSAANKEHQNTADQQSEKASDRQITQKIRQSLMADKSLSTNAHNCKIITKNGQVTLKGTVNSENEKQTIATKAADVVGGPDKVNNQLTVKQ